MYMEKLVEGNPRGFQRGPNGAASRLPPRIPAFPGRALIPSDLGAAIHGSQIFESRTKDQTQHKRTPSCTIVMQEQPAWLDELLEEPDGSVKKSSHRRSASDSFAFLEDAGSLCMLGNVADQEESNHASFLAEKEKSANMIINCCLTDLFDEIQQLQMQRNIPTSAMGQSTVSSCEFPRLDDIRPLPTRSDNTLTSNLKGLPRQAVSLPEDKSLGAADAASHDNPAVDVNGESKKAKRQSAQRSRVRKLQYIVELERIVNALQTQVSSLSPHVLHAQHQRTLLSMDNTALKQKIAVCIRERNVKDSQNKTLSSEVQRLKWLHELQLLHDSQTHKQQSNRIHRHSSLPIDFGVQLDQHKEPIVHSAEAELAVPSPDMLPQVMEELAGMSLNA